MKIVQNMISIAKWKQQDKYDFLHLQLYVICQVGNRKMAFVAFLIARKTFFLVEHMKNVQICDIRKKLLPQNSDKAGQNYCV